MNPSPMGEIEYVDANGLRFAYLSEGTGPLVLLLHGFPDTAHSWDDVRPRIAALGLRGVSPFMRGYHPTGIPARDPDHQTLALDALGLIGALGAAEAIVVGHDWGAFAAYGAAAIDPARIKKLITIAIPHPATWRVSARKAWGVRHFLAYKLPGAAARFAADDFAALPAICKRWSPTWSPSREALDPVRACFSKPESLNAALGYYRALGVTIPPTLKKKITVPTVAFAGLDDPIAEPGDYHHAAGMFEAGYVVEEMPGGHFLHREHPETFAERLLPHLGSR